jgi:CRISPR-associated protein Csc2
VEGKEVRVWAPPPQVSQKPHLWGEIGKKVFGNNINKILEWAVKREKPEKYHAIVKGKVANVFVVIEAYSRLIIRHEQDTEDVTVVPTYTGHSVPAILNTKFQSGAVRRQMLATLHEWFDRKGKHHVDELKKLGYNSDTYTCAVRPYMRREREKQAPKQAPEEVEGFCERCPSCLIFGYAVQEAADYNVKSRVEGDLYVSPIPEEKSVIRVTFNAVDDITKTTVMPGEGGARTGALYTYKMIEVGTPFVGKLVLRDMTFAELMLALLAVARTTRIGGRVTHFGEIRVHIPAILFSKYEIGSGYEIANMILSESGGKVLNREEVINKVTGYVKMFENQGILVLDRELGDKLRGLSEEEVDAIILEAWKDTLIYKTSLDEFVGKQRKPQ